MSITTVDWLNRQFVFVRLLMYLSPQFSCFLFLCRACVILGVIFILSSLCILGKAIHDLAIRLLPEVVRNPHQ